MLTQMPRSNHASEDIYEQRDIDEASVETDVGNIADPDVIASGDLKGLKAVDPETHPLKRLRVWIESKRFIHI